MGALTRQYAEQNSKFAKPEHGQKRHAAQLRLFDVERRVITLTTFSKTRNNERRQVQRARDAQKDYERRDGS